MATMAVGLVGLRRNFDRMNALAKCLPYGFAALASLKEWLVLDWIESCISYHVFYVFFCARLACRLRTDVNIL